MGNVKTGAKKAADVIETALDRYKVAEEAESDNRIAALADLQFAHGEQWDKASRDFREKDEYGPRICLTINRVPSFIRRVVNDIRQMRPSIKVRPVDSQADPETAKVINGMIRAIEGACNAEAAYDWAAEFAVKMGWGYIRVTTEYEGDEDFKQSIKIRRVLNPFSVHMDPNATEPDGSDAEWCFVSDSMPREEFEAKYPDAHSEWSGSGTGENDEDWFEEDKIRVAEYWTREEVEIQLSMLPNGQIVEGVSEDAIAKRTIRRTTITQRLITGQEVLEETQWLGRYIPIIPVYGEEINIEGETLLQGMVRDLRDSQRAYNFARSVEVERSALSPKAPWVGPEGSFTDPKWKNANRKNYPYLEYVNQGVPPTRVMPPDVSPGLSQMQQVASQELRDITGIQDDINGPMSVDQSGVQLRQRRGESDVSNFHYADNLSRAIRHVGRILVDLIPKLFTEQEMVQIVDPDGTERAVGINGEWMDPKSGKMVTHNIKAGKYDATVDTGPGYATQRQEAAQGMIDLVKGSPQLMGIIGDMLVKALDWPDSQEVSERLKLMLPPEIAKNENPQVAAVLKQSQAQMQQLQQAMGQLQKYAQQLEQQVTSKEGELRIKAGELKVKAGELQRKKDEDSKDFAHDMTKLELDASKNVPGAVV